MHNEMNKKSQIINSKITRGMEWKISNLLTVR